jgi:prepilin-type N-terminal cleavage/methylation domain-containing protein
MQPKNNRQLKTQKAFTLIELLVVIAIVGILAGLAVVNMSGSDGRSEDSEAEGLFQLDQIFSDGESGFGVEA